MVDAAERMCFVYLSLFLCQITRSSFMLTSRTQSPPYKVAKHNSTESCWVALYGYVYDVTSFLSTHPAGPSAILALAGVDATAEYDPVHPPGTLEQHLKPDACLGRFIAAPADPQTKTPDENADAKAPPQRSPPPLESLLNLDEFEHAAGMRLSQRAWAYYSSGSDDMRSMALNRAAYSKVLLRPRYLIDCTACSTATALLVGALPVGLPVFVAPPPASRPRSSSPTTRPWRPRLVVADAAPHQVFGWQLYVQRDRAVSEAMLARINRLRPYFRFIVLTVDAPELVKREADRRLRFTVAGAERAQVNACDLTWETTVDWLAAHTDLPIVIKGLLSYKDVVLASRFAPRVRAVILSNHGGRALDVSQSALHALREVRRHCPDALRRLEVWIDGGVRRGTDIVKAVCLGATAVGIGRAPLYGLAVGGQAGVERLFESWGVFFFWPITRS